jgi:hypothetical protein
VSWEAAATEASSARVSIAFAESCRGDSPLTPSSAVRRFSFAVSARLMETVRARAVIFSWEEAAEYPCQHNAAVARPTEAGPLCEALSPFLVVLGFFIQRPHTGRVSLPVRSAHRAGRRATALGLALSVAVTRRR